MGSESAHEAKLGATRTLDLHKYLTGVGPFATEFTLVVGAPSDFGIFIGEGLDQPLPVLVSILFDRVKEFLEN